MNTMATTTGNVELYKTANAQASFICEAMLGFKADDGQTYNKIVLVIVKRDSQNKAETTVRYFLDVPAAKVLCHDLWEGALHEEHSEFKKRGNTQRALEIVPTEGNAYRFTIMNDESGEKQRLFFELNRFQTRCLTRTVLDYLQAWELATVIQDVMR
jgi:hypothetical protein